MPFQDNHMDELFQRAAENFPLKDPDDHWNSIQIRLNNPDTTPVKDNSLSKGILFALLSILCLHLPFLLFDNTYKNESVLNYRSSVSNLEQEGLSQNNQEVHEGQSIPANTIIPQGLQYGLYFPKARIMISDALQNTNPILHQNDELNKMTGVTDVKKNNEVVLNPEPKNLNQHSLNNKQENTLHPDSLQTHEATAMEKIAVSEFPVADASKIPDKAIKKPVSGLYVGINTGISFSNVKRQQLSSPGFTAGIGLGYRFSPKWSAETGVKFSEKKYYSDGVYFSKKNLPPDMKVVSVESRTLLLEIPLKAKFDFKQTPKGQFFLTGGISSYVVGKEINDYIIFRNGANRPMQATYQDNKSYLAAAIEFSAGYEKYFKNKQTLRIEPWIQIARKGIGIGQLPVSGFGIQAGYFFLK
jgi:hypothetical protein